MEYGGSKPSPAAVSETHEKLFRALFSTQAKLVVGVRTDIPGLKIPESLRTIPSFTLCLEPGNPQNNRDFDCDARGWGATLSFDATPHIIDVPWAAVTHLDTGEFVVLFRQQESPVEQPAGPPKLRLVKDESN